MTTGQRRIFSFTSTHSKLIEFSKCSSHFVFTSQLHMYKSISTDAHRLPQKKNSKRADTKCRLSSSQFIFTQRKHPVLERFARLLTAGTHWHGQECHLSRWEALSSSRRRVRVPHVVYATCSRAFSLRRLSMTSAASVSLAIVYPLLAASFMITILF